MSKNSKLVLFSFLLLLAYLLLSPTPLNIQPADLPKFKLQRQLSSIPNLDLNRLSNAFYIHLPQKSIEDIAVDKNGNIYIAAGTGPSKIYKLNSANYSIFSLVAETEGQVLGTSLNSNETVLALVDQKLGLRLLHLQTGKIQTVASQYNGNKLKSINSVTFTNDPNILYFTHSSIFSMDVYHLEILYKTASGKIFQLNLANNKIRPIVTDLQFPNGITYSQQHHSLFVTELGRYRVIKVPLNKQNFNYSVVAQNLVGYPDNIKISEDGNIWVALCSIRDKLNVFLDNTPILRKLLINLHVPQSIFSSLANFSYTGGIKINSTTGQIMDYFMGQSNRIFFSTTVMQKNKKIYISSLKLNVIAIIDYL